MSVHVTAWVWENNHELKLTGNTLVVMLKLADNSNSEGICYPSITNIAKCTAMARPTVIKHIGILERAGIIGVIECKGKSNRYIMKMYCDAKGIKYKDSKIREAPPEKEPTSKTVFTSKDGFTTVVNTGLLGSKDGFTQTVINHQEPPTNGSAVAPSEPIEQSTDETPQTGNPFFDEHTPMPIDEGMATLKPAWEKALPVVAELYGQSEDVELMKVLACYFTRESRYIPKKTEWDKCVLSEAMTLDDIKAMLQHWKDTLPAMPRKPMTLQANVDKWNKRKQQNIEDGMPLL